MAQKINIGIHIGSGSVSVAVAISNNDQSPKILKWPPNESTAVPLYARDAPAYARWVSATNKSLRVIGARRIDDKAGDGDGHPKWGGEILDEDCETSLPLFAAGEWLGSDQAYKLPEILCRRQGALQFRPVKSVIGSSSKNATNAMVNFIRAIAGHVEKEIINTYGEATCQKQVYITVPAYYNAAQRRRYKELLVEHFFFRPSLQAALGFVDQCEACLLCLVGDKVEFNMERNDALIVCHVEEQTTIICAFRILETSPRFRVESIYPSCHEVLLFGLDQLGEIFQIQLCRQMLLEASTVTLEGVSGREILRQVVKERDKFLLKLYDKDAEKPERISRKSAASHCPADETFLTPYLNRLFGAIEKYDKQNRNQNHLLFTGGLCECPYLHTYMQDRFENGIEILDSTDESTFAARGAVFKGENNNSMIVDIVGRSLEMDHPATTLEVPSHLDELRKLKSDIHLLTQKPHPLAKFLPIYEMIVIDLMSRIGCDHSEVTSSVLQIELLHRQSGHPDRGARFCEDFLERYFKQEIHQPELEVVVEPQILDADRLKLTRDRIETPIQLAAALDQLDVVRICVAAGAIVDAPLRFKSHIHCYTVHGHTALYVAVRRQRESMVRLLLEHGANPNARPEHKFGPLHAAAEWGNDAVVRMLLQNGAEINMKYSGGDDHCGYTALHCAAERGHICVVRTLLEHGADPLATCEHQGGIGMTAIYFAALNGHNDIILALLDTAFNFVFGELHSLRVAALFQDMDNIRRSSFNQDPEEMLLHLLKERRIMVDVRFENNDCGNCYLQSTPLHFSARLGWSKAVLSLLEQGADPNAACQHIKYGVEVEMTPLELAQDMGHESTARILQNFISDINKKCPRGTSPDNIRVDPLLPLRTLPTLKAAVPNDDDISQAIVELSGHGFNLADKYIDKTGALLWAARNGSYAAIWLLLDKGADIATTDDIKLTALHHAASREDEKVVQLLLEKGADINVKTKNGWTALYEAASRRDEKVVQLLLEKGADIAARNIDGWTALHKAASLGDKRVIQLLLEKGADITARNMDGWTALHEAAILWDERVIQLLLEKGADIAAKNNDRSTALHLAAFYGHERLVHVLLEKGADIAAKNSKGQTAQQSAADRGHKGVMLLLLEKKAGVAAKNSEGRTGQQSAADGGRKRVV